MNQLRMKQFTDELNDNDEEDEMKKKASEQRNEYLGLRQQVENLLNVRDEARKEIKELKTQIKTKDKALSQKT